MEKTSLNNQVKKIVVTGGSGFLGHHLIKALLEAGYEVKNIDLKEFPQHDSVKDLKVRTVIGDVRDLKLMEKELAGADLVFHLASLIEAGESVKHPGKFVDYNVVGMLHVLEAMRTNKVKNFIFSSSAAVYGEPVQVPIKEDDRTIPINPYGMTKLAMEGLLSSYVSSFRFSGVALRYFNLYGTEEHHVPETHAIPRFIEQIYQDQEVTVWGSGEHQRDYIHIRDIVDAHLKAIKLVEEKPQEYHYLNLSTEQPASVLELVKIIEQAMSKKANVKHFPPRPGDPLLLYADASKARATLGWEPQVKLEDGLKEVVEYFLKIWNRK
jgi:UDP-glucose 4-epimerase